MIPVGKASLFRGSFSHKTQRKSYPPERRDLLEGEEREKIEYLARGTGAGDKWKEIL